MARLKKVYRDEKFKLAKKREKIRSLALAVTLILSFAMLCVGGYFQHDPVWSGFSILAIGIVFIGYACFEFWTRAKGWQYLTPFDDANPKTRHICRDLADKDRINQSLRMLIMDITMLILGIAGVIAGVLKILDRK